MQAPAWTGAGLGFSATAAGLLKLPSNLMATLAAPLGGWLAGRGGGRVAMIIGGLVTITGWACAWVSTSSPTIVAVELIIIAFGATMLFTVAPTIIAQASPPDRVSEIAGLLTVVRGLFMGIGAQMVATLLATDTVARGAERFPSSSAYELTIFVIIALCALATLLCLALPKSNTDKEHAHAPTS
jgi:MFS family permease